MSARLPGFIALGWFFSVASRQLVQLDESFALFLRLSLAIRSVAYLLVLGGVGLALGRRIHRACGFSDGDPGVTLALSGALGLGVLGLSSLALGYLGWIGTPAALGLLGVALLIGHNQFREIRDLVRAAFGGSFSFWCLILMGLVGMSFLLAISPPVYGDEVAYQAYLPQEFARTGRIPLIGDTKYLYFPLLCHALAGMGVAAGIPQAPRLDQFLFGSLLLTGLGGWARRNGASAVLAAVLFAGMPIATLTMGLSHVTMAKTFLQTALLLAFLDLVETPTWSKAVGAGLLLGTFLWIKQVALASVVALALVFLVGRPLPRRYSLVTLCVGLGLFAPFLIKNFCLVGDPLFPYLWPHFHGAGWNVFLQRNELKVCGRLNRPTLGALLSFILQLLTGPDRSNYEGQGVGMHLIGLAGVLLVLRRELKDLALVLGFGLLYGGLWALGTGPLVTRSLLPVAPIACVAIAMGLARLGERSSLLAATLKTLLVVSLLITIPIRPMVLVLPFVSGLATEEQTRERAWGAVVRVEMAMDQVLAPGTRVLGFYAGQRLYTHCRLIDTLDLGGSFFLGTRETHAMVERDARVFPSLAGNPGDGFPLIETADQARDWLEKQDIHYVLMNDEEVPGQIQFSVFNLVKDQLELKMRQGGVALWKLRPARGRAALGAAHVENHPGPGAGRSPHGSVPW